MTKILNETVKRMEELVRALVGIKDDLSSLKTSVDSEKTLSDEIHDDHADLITVVGDLKTLVNDLRTLTQAHPLGNPGLQIDTNFDVNNANAIDYQIAGSLYTLSATTTADTGTSAQLDAGNWGVFLVSINDAGNATATWDDNSGAGYSSEANAIAALPSTPTDECPIGYVTVQADGSNPFTAGTDALQGGSGGNPAQTTTYYDMFDAQSAVSAAVTSSAPAGLAASKATSVSTLETQ